MNSSKEHDEFTEGDLPNVEIIDTPRVWMFGGIIDGIWILFPVAVFGTIVNGFLVSEEINACKRFWNHNFDSILDLDFEN